MLRNYYVCLGLILSVWAAGCGDGGSARVDAGACPTVPFTMAWPSEQDPQVCSRTVEGLDDAVRTQCGEVDENCAADNVTVPVLDCLTNPNLNPPVDPAMVTLKGYADVFSSGPDSHEARLELYRASDITPAVTSFDQVTPIATVDLVLDANTVTTARACPQDINEPAELRGDCVVPDSNCTGCDYVLGAIEFCYQTQCYAMQRYEIRYEMQNIPTNTFLIGRSIGLTAGQPDVTDETWAPLVQYNIFLSTAQRECTGLDDNNCINHTDTSYQLNANLLSRSDYDTIPVTAGLSGGVQVGHGSLAGEVHDCEDVRVQNVQVGFRPLPLKVTFFNGNPVKTLPLSARGPLGTNALGLFAGFDIAPQEVLVHAIGNVNGAATSFGSFRARTWPDTVTVFDINAGTPPQQ